ncbi:fumipyrrole biosynthesis protein C [Colletotrichum liriopes]|uniref:Fumipyrrole biosynthesis protein C n=1 Tax=Colletotrichum liriopes TaxID=708192 RepID=A0AA37GY55_9PEZI|nr:fumipyrrole biosynthesis protein C [Colletotrichum liriopes]
MGMHFRCLDLIISVVPSVLGGAGLENDSDEGLAISGGSGLGALTELVRTCYTKRLLTEEVEVATKVIFVAQKGYLCRSDILELRMLHSEFVASVIKLSSPGAQFLPVQTDGGSTLPALLSSSPGVLVANKYAKSHHEALGLLDRDLNARLSFDWVLPTAPVARTVAVVGGRPMFDMTKGSYGSEGPFDAARALGLSIIVLDRPGHWLENGPYSYLRDDFIAIDVSDEIALPSNIVKAVDGRSLDAIVTFSDEFVIATAKAAEMLKLLTEPVEAILQAHYKAGTRSILRNSTIQAVHLENKQQLEEPSTINLLGTLRYPLVVKPCRGGASRGVKRVNDELGLRQAIRQMDEGLSKYGILLETYAEGPEVDANFVLWDGEILFFEISDDFPCQADAKDATVSDNFAETVVLLPSRLDAREIDLLRSTLHQNLLQLGFRSGVFHVEARVRNSSMCYRELDGVVDLAHGNTPAKAPSDAFLIEVNARPPGIQGVFPALHTYGVDYCALQYLRALGDYRRLVALSSPFSYPSQYWCGVTVAPIHREAIVVPDGLLDSVMQRLPEVAPHVSRAELLTQPGSILSPRGGAGFVAYFMVRSRISRKHVLEMCARLREVSKDVLDGL